MPPIASYSAGDGLPPIMQNRFVFTIHNDRTRVIDNKTVMRKMRLPRNTQIRSQQMWATASSPFNPSAIVSMPFAGNLLITISGGTIDFDNSLAFRQSITILNPFVSATSAVVVNSINNNGGNAILSRITATASAGQISIDGNAAVSTTILAGGQLSVSVGTRTDS